MVNVSCSACSGTGQITCPYCNGQGQNFTHVGAQVQYQPCLVCGGRRKITCTTCGEEGQVQNPAPPAVTPGPAATVPVEIQGRWRGESGDTFDFIPDIAGFHVNHFNSIGMKIEEGRVTQNGNSVTITLQSLMGSSTAKLRLCGNMLEGEMLSTAIGIPLPLVIFKPPS